MSLDPGHSFSQNRFVYKRTCQGNDCWADTQVDMETQALSECCCCFSCEVEGSELQVPCEFASAFLARLGSPMVGFVVLRTVAFLGCTYKSIHAGGRR